MAKQEILMWVAGVMMMIILGLAVAPTVTKSGETAKIAVINSEISAIRNAAVMYSIDNGGKYSGITALGLMKYLPLKAGWINPLKLSSKVDSNIEYNIQEFASGDKFQIEVTRIFMQLSTSARTSVLNTQATIADSAVQDSGSDLITLTYKQ